MLETLDYTIRIGSTPTFLYFDSVITVAFNDLVYNSVVISRFEYIYTLEDEGMFWEID